MGSLSGLQLMKILLVGATGKTGSEVVKVCLARGHEVTAYVRSPQKLAAADAKLKVQSGELFDAPKLAATMCGQEAVVSCLGLPARQALRPSRFMTESAAAIVSAMSTAGVARLCILSAAVLFPGRGLQYAFFKWLLQHHARDLERMEALVRASDLEWTLPRPPRLIHSADARYLSEVNALPANSAFSATFRGVASFMADAVEQRRYIRQIVGVASPR